MKYLHDHRSQKICQTCEFYEPDYTDPLHGRCMMYPMEPEHAQRAYKDTCDEWFERGEDE